MSLPEQDNDLREAIDIAKAAIDKYEELSDIAEPIFREWLIFNNHREKLIKLENALGGQDKLQELVHEAHKFLAIQEHNINAAKRPRTDALSQTIMRILLVMPNATSSDVQAKLRLMAGVREPPIELVSEKEIEWTDKKGCARTTLTSSLKNRIYRLRKQSK